MDTKMSMDNLLRAICEKQNPTVAGLDPKLDYVPQYIKDKAFNKYGETDTSEATVSILL